ncbi:CotH kinase family protein [Empedobacter falsenii]
MKNIYFLPLLFITPLFGQSLDLPEFSKESGFYDSQFELILSHKDPNTTIIYTLDGSEPDINNLDGRTYQYKKQYPQYPEDTEFQFYENTLKSNKYTNPIVVYNRTSEPNRIANISTTFKSQPYFPSTKIDKSFVVRAKAFSNDATSNTVTQVYFFNENTYTLPIINFTTDDENLFGYEKGLFVAGRTFDEWRKNNPQTEINAFTPANYWASGSESEIRLNVIYLENKISKLNHDAGLRNNGNGTRYLANRPFRIYAKDAYGSKNFNHQFFKDYGYDKFKRLILRNSGQDTESTLFRDALIHKLNEHMNSETQNYQPVNTFVNGEYYGIYNIRERYDEKYFERVFGIKEDELDYLENDGIVDLGDDKFYNQTMNFFQNVNLESEEKFQEAITYVDEINLADYHITGIYAANFDWPQNNNVYFRKRVDYNPSAKFGQDGRWRWLVKDYDVAMNGGEGWINNTANHNTLAHALSNDVGGFIYTNYIFNGLLTNANYKNYFINRFSDLLNTSYKENHVLNLIENIKSVLEPDMPKHIERWNLIPSLDVWETNIDKLRKFANERRTAQLGHINNQFNLEGTYQLTAKTSNPEEGFVKVNTIEINNSTVGIDGDYSTWSGDYFKNVPVKLQAVALPGYKFLRWEGDYTSTDAELTINPALDYTIKAVFAKNDLSTGDIDKVDFILFPNPVQDILNIASSSKSKIEYKISNIIGQIVEHNSTNNQKIDVSKLKQGVYIIQLTQDNKRTTKKFIKK